MEWHLVYVNNLVLVYAWLHKLQQRMHQKAAWPLLLILLEISVTNVFLFNELNDSS